MAYHFTENRIFQARDVIRRKNTRPDQDEFHRRYVVLDFLPDGIEAELLKSDQTLGQSYLLRSPQDFEKVGYWNGEYNHFVTLDVPLEQYTQLGGSRKIYEIAKDALAIATVKTLVDDWHEANVLDTAAAARYTGLAVATIRGALNRGEIPGAWKPDGSKIWLMLRDDVDAWRASKGKE